MNVRSRLAASTRQIHEALHGHAVFRPLFDGTARPEDLARVLAAFRDLFNTVEAARAERDLWPDLTLAAELRALNQDLKAFGAAGSLRRQIFAAETDHALLGALYVAHGAAFGRSTMVKAMPDLASRTDFLRLRPDPARWGRLLSILETEGACGVDQMTDGAHAAFAIFARLADREMPSACNHLETGAGFGLPGAARNASDGAPV